MKFIYCSLPKRENNSFLIDDIHSIVSLNYVYCLYFNVILLSDITNINGNSIIPRTLLRDKSNILTSTFYWPLYNHLPISNHGHYGLALLLSYIVTIIKH